MQHTISLHVVILSIFSSKKNMLNLSSMILESWEFGNKKRKTKQTKKHKNLLGQKKNLPCWVFFKSLTISRSSLSLAWS
jgi:hypothetical protein